MRIRAAVVWVMSILLIACTIIAKTGTNCDLQPPLTEMEKPSEMLISLDPNPVLPGAPAVLSIRVGGGVTSGDAVSQGASWDCWNGARWVGTYQIVRYAGGFTDPNRVKPGSVTSVVGIWFPTPNEHDITTPEVPAGTYRISDRTRNNVTGFTYVEVLDP